MIDLKDVIKEAVEYICREYNPVSVILSGSAARGADFVHGISDLDFIVISDSVPVLEGLKGREEIIKSKSFQGISSDMPIETPNRFEENLKKGCAFELYALHFGKCVYGEDIRTRLNPADYKPTEETLRFHKQSALNRFCLALKEYFEPYGYFSNLINEVYHSARECARALVSRQGKMADGHKDISEAVREINPSLTDLINRLYQDRKNWKNFPEDVSNNKATCIDENHFAGKYILDAENVLISTLEELENWKLPRINDLLEKVKAKKGNCSWYIHSIFPQGKIGYDIIVIGENEGKKEFVMISVNEKGENIHSFNYE